MDEPKADKVAIVQEVRERLDAASASVVTEYRGLTVKEIADLRRSLSEAGSDYKIFKNTLVRRAVVETDHRSLEPLLVGPTAIAFVRDDVSAVAKALRDFSRTYPSLVIKGGLLDGALLSERDLAALADLPSREVLLSQFAGALAAPLRQLASLLEAMPRNLAYGFQALIDSRGEGQAPSPPAASSEAAADEAPVANADPETVNDEPTANDEIKE